MRVDIVGDTRQRREPSIEIGEEVPGRYMMTAAVVLSALLGIALAYPSDDWTSFVLARSGAAFGETDPYSGVDLGFFVFWLPFENALWNWAFLCIAVVAVAVMLLYALTPSLRWRRGSLYVSMYVRRHVAVIVGKPVFTTYAAHCLVFRDWTEIAGFFDAQRSRLVARRPPSARRSG